MELGKSDLKNLIRNIARQGWSDKKINDLVDSLWREKFLWPDEVIYGYVVWRGGFNFRGSNAKFRINNIHYKAPTALFTLDAADATWPRIDLVTLNTDGEWEIIKGTPAENPLKPTYNRDTNIEVTFIEVPAAATQPENMVEGQIYDEHTAGEWTPSVVGTTANWDSTDTPSKGSKCAAIGELSNGDTIVFTATEDYRDTDWATLSFDLQLPNTASRGNYIEVYFTYNGRGRSKMLQAIYNRLSTNWQKVVFTIPAFAIRNTLFNGLVLRWSNSGGTYAGIKIDNVLLQKGIELPQQTDNYVTGASWDEATSTLTLHRTGSLGDITVEITGAGSGDDGLSAYEVAVANGFVGTEAEWLASLVGDDGDDGTSSYTYVAYASDNAGTGFSLTPTDVLKYRAEIHRTSPLSPPTSSDFTGATWVKYIGDDGADGEPAPGDNTYIGLDDTSDTTYTGKDKYVPMVNEATEELDLTETEISAVIHVGTTPPADTTKLWFDTN